MKVLRFGSTATILIGLFYAQVSTAAPKGATKTTAKSPAPAAAAPAGQKEQVSPEEVKRPWKRGSWASLGRRRG